MNPKPSPAPDLSGLSEWAPELAQTFVSLASDIALVLDDTGVIRSVAQGGPKALGATAQGWIGRSWADTVSGDTRGKIEKLLEDVNATGLARRREIDHLSAAGDSIPVAYTAIRLGQNGPLLAVGRDLGAIGAIQQRFQEAQQEMERGYWRARQAEARYRLLFQVATDAVLVVDAETLEILEANHAASQLFDLPVEQVVGRPVSFGFERHSRGIVEELLATARASGTPSEIRARLLGKASSTSVVASAFRTEDAMRLLVRVRTMDMPGASADLNATLARLVDGASDGIVVTDSSGRIMLANPAFLKLVRLGTEASVKGLPLMDWIGVTDAQFAALLAQVRRQGITRRLASRLMSTDAQVSDVEVSAALLTVGDQECLGVTLHFVAGPPRPVADVTDGLRDALEQLSQRVGTADLPELLHAAAALVERHFVRVALLRSDHDTDAAASLLGVDARHVAQWQQGMGRSGPEGV